MGKKSSVNLFDSEMFEWTQRPCSPELFSSPSKMQVVIELKQQDVPTLFRIVCSTVAPIH